MSVNDGRARDIDSAGAVAHMLIQLETSVGETRERARALGASWPMLSSLDVARQATREAWNLARVRLARAMLEDACEELGKPLEWGLENENENEDEGGDRP